MPAAAAVRRRVRVEMRPEGGKTVRGDGLPGEERADAAGPVITAESSPCGKLARRGACWATVVGAAGASVEPLSLPIGQTTTEAKAVLAVGGKTKQARTAIDGDGGSRCTSDESPRRSRKVVDPHTWPVCAKIAKIAKIRTGRRQTTQDGAFEGGAPAHSSRRRESVKSECEPAGSDEEDTAVLDRGDAATVDPLRSSSVAGFGKRDKKQPLALPMRYSSV